MATTKILRINNMTKSLYHQKENEFIIYVNENVNSTYNK